MRTLSDLIYINTTVTDLFYGDEWDTALDGGELS